LAELMSGPASRGSTIESTMADCRFTHSSESGAPVPRRPTNTRGVALNRNRPPMPITRSSTMRGSPSGRSVVMSSRCAYTAPWCPEGPDASRKSITSGGTKCASLTRLAYLGERARLDVGGECHVATVAAEHHPLAVRQRNRSTMSRNRRADSA
jgi:hypothetical protein